MMNNKGEVTVDSSGIDIGKAVVIAFNREHRVGAHVQYWTGVREGRGKFSTTRQVAELSTAGIPVVWIAGQAGYVALSHVEPVPQQPEDIDEYDDFRLPSATGAVDRVREYVTAFGDGLYDVTDGAPLYGRDLEALCREVERLTREAETMTVVAQSNKRHVAGMLPQVEAAYAYADLMDGWGGYEEQARELRERLDQAKPDNTATREA